MRSEGVVDSRYSSPLAFRLPKPSELRSGGFTESHGGNTGPRIERQTYWGSPQHSFGAEALPIAKHAVKM